MLTRDLYFYSDGMVISSFMHSGTIATLMHYGLAWLTPGLFCHSG